LAQALPLLWVLAVLEVRVQIRVLLVLILYLVLLHQLVAAEVVISFTRVAMVALVAEEMRLLSELEHQGKVMQAV
jgi:hypothetical protein